MNAKNTQTTTETNQTPIIKLNIIVITNNGRSKNIEDYREDNNLFNITRLARDINNNLHNFNRIYMTKIKEDENTPYKFKTKKGNLGGVWVDEHLLLNFLAYHDINIMRILTENILGNTNIFSPKYNKKAITVTAK